MSAFDPSSIWARGVNELLRREDNNDRAGDDGIGRPGVEPSDRGTNAAPKRWRTMPRYFFHLHNDYDAPDEEGAELPSLEAAKIAALHNARFSAAETIKENGRFVGEHRIDIADGDGNVLDTVYFRDAVQVRP
jgi:hypothetical protein